MAFAKLVTTTYVHPKSPDINLHPQFWKPGDTLAPASLQHSIGGYFGTRIKISAEPQVGPLEAFRNQAANKLHQETGPLLMSSTTLDYSHAICDDSLTPGHAPSPGLRAGGWQNLLLVPWRLHAYVTRSWRGCHGDLLHGPSVPTRGLKGGDPPRGTMKDSSFLLLCSPLSAADLY